MERTPPDLAEARESFEQIGQEGQRAAEVIESVRSMFRSRELAHASIDLNQLIREVLALVESTVQKRGIVIGTELDETLVPVTGNRVQLQQVLFNLLTNAIEATKSVVDRKVSIRSKLADDGGVGAPSKIPAAALTRRFSTKSSIHSSQPKPRAWEWACRSADRLSNRTVDVFGFAWSI